MSTAVAQAQGAQGAVFITRDAALAALFFFGDPAGRDPGEFTTALMTAMAHADRDNLEKLVRAFPTIGAAFLTGKHRIEALRRGVQS